GDVAGGEEGHDGQAGEGGVLAGAGLPRAVRLLHALQEQEGAVDGLVHGRPPGGRVGGAGGGSSAQYAAPRTQEKAGQQTSSGVHRRKPRGDSYCLTASYFFVSAICSKYSLMTRA